MNYKGYFRGLHNDNLYEVQLISDTTSTTFSEIALAGDAPFTVTYNESQTPFDPVRTSTATIQIVSGYYFDDLYEPYAHAVQVKLYNKTTNNCEWLGFLVPRTYNQSYDDCLEVIQLEAADCISSLQYFNYEPIGATRAIVTVKDIINAICDKCELLAGYYWTRSKKVGSSILLPNALMISEQNFYSSDTDESWKMSEVLEEICRYFGFTAVQWRDRLYFVDYQYLTVNENIYATPYMKANSYAEGTAVHLVDPFVISEESYMGNEASISFEPVYNKVTVRDNFYTADEFIPSIFEDRYLTNRIVPCNFYADYEVTPETPDKATYDWKSGHSTIQKSESSADTSYRYFQRPYTHEYWDSHYYNTGKTEVTLSDSTLATYSTVRDYIGGTIIDIAAVRNTYEEKDGHKNYQTIVPSKRDFDRCICISQKGNGVDAPGGRNFIPMLKLKDGFKSLCPFSDYAYLVIDYTVMFEKYENRAYINPDWTSETVSWGAGYTQGPTDGYLFFRVTIGDYYWDDFQQEWILTSDTRYNYWSAFGPHTKWADTKPNTGSVQEDRKCLNTITWDEQLGVEGFKVPLAGMSMNENLCIEVMLPSIQFMHDYSYKWNQYCWVKDLTFKIVESGQDSYESDTDIVYENIIDADSLNELNEITVKLTTQVEGTKPSYSNVVYFKNGRASMLDTVVEDAISGTIQKPEENIIEKYVNQYGSPTKKISATQTLDITPLSKVYYVDVDYPENGYAVLGSEIDYRAGSQRITMIEMK